MDGVALRPLTVGFHEPGFIATLNGEGAQADKLHWGGPVNPQALNRYSYVQNNPMRWVDPTGHSKSKVGSEEASYDDACTKGGAFVDCDASGATKVYYEDGSTLKQVCSSGECQYIKSGSGLFQEFARKVDSMVTNLLAAGVATATAVGALWTGLASCPPTVGSGCVAGVSVAIVSGVIALVYLGAATDDTRAAKRIYGDVKQYNRTYRVKYP